MDPELQRAFIVVLIAGSIVIAVGTVTLYLVFRAYGGEKAGGKSHRTLVAALVGFIFLCCLGLLALSYR
jgi:multisubunit Na+/H+ antiporter MnhB subunit